MAGNYFHGIEPSEVSVLEFGEFPAIEALGFAVIEMRQRARWIRNEVDEETDLAGSYSVQTVF